MSSIKKFFKKWAKSIADEKAYQQSRKDHMEEMLASSLANQPKSGDECKIFDWSPEMIKRFEEASELPSQGSRGILEGVGLVDKGVTTDSEILAMKSKEE
jgi:hypothetical protein